MRKAFTGLIADMLIRYCPGSQKWEDRAEMLKEASDMIPKDRPLKAEKTDTRPFGVFDVNEGSKKGIVKVVEQIQERSTLTKEEWSAKTRILEGDWLTANNVRAARRDRFDDVDTMERVENPEELSALWHHALQASHKIMRTHYGNAVLDPTSLAAHKGLLNRTWDVNKPNYAAAKALIKHSLIARLLHIVMLFLNMTLWSELSAWRPNMLEIREISEKITAQFATTAAAEDAKKGEDDYLAHTIYFIRDALFFFEFEHAVSWADAGRVLRVLKYWAFSFRGASQHNYARECAEILIKLKYEVTQSLRVALEKAWFVNRWGLDGRWIPADLYLEQLNFWVKRVFIAQGNGVTVEYIMEKGSACVEAFRDITHLVANFFGDADRARRSKELAFQEDMRVLVEQMVKQNAHVMKKGNFVPAMQSKRQKKTPDTAKLSAIVDVFAAGADIWNQGKFTEFIKKTTYDPALGYPIDDTTRAQTRDARLDTGTVFDSTSTNPIQYDSYEDIHGNENMEGDGSTAGALGGGEEYANGEVTW
ncbi:hypothetical protein PLICRDRAFT_170448 [Plicaturopsis crispa FD-325 SS-3]|nr:hypothetical protein PLICRDRAFT_170448 [Plicaturopsis crispa FD-325 SS-3]